MFFKTLLQTLVLRSLGNRKSKFWDFLQCRIKNGEKTPKMKGY